MMNSIFDDIVKIILTYCIENVRAMMTTCTKWTAWLLPGGDVLTLDYIKNHEFPVCLPASCYRHFTRLQKIKLPNCHRFDPLTSLSIINEEFLMDWTDIKEYLIEDPRRIHEIFVEHPQEPLLFMQHSEQFFKHMFKHCEQYRYFILTCVSQEKIRSIMTYYGGWDPVQSRENSDKITDDIWTAIDSAGGTIFLDIALDRADLYGRYLKTI